MAGSTEEVLVYFRVTLRSVSETNRRSWVTEPQGELSFGSCTLLLGFEQKSYQSQLQEMIRVGVHLLLGGQDGKGS